MNTSLYNKKATSIKFLILVPEKDGLWKMNGSKRKTPELLYRLLERKITKILGVDHDAKIAVKVKYDKDTSNESLRSSDINYLLYTASCFLEDYLSKEGLNRLYKKYAKGNLNSV